jgi:hypothetical protein
MPFPGFCLRFLLLNNFRWSAKIVKTPIHDRDNLAADFAGDGFLSIAKRFRQLEDEDPKLLDVIVKLLDVDRADADFMVRVNRTFRRLRVNENHMAALGWPKLIVLVDHISLGNRQQLLELADKVTAKELASILGQRFTTKRMVLRLTQDQYRVLAEAILAYGGVQSEGDSDELSGKEEALVQALTFKKP